jgi:HK97 family phage major capsid protein
MEGAFMASINEMRGDRARIFEEAKALVERAESEARDLSAEEQGAWEQMNSDIDELGRQINITERQERIDAVRSSLDVNHRPASSPAQDFEQRFARFLNGEVRSFEITAHDYIRPEQRQLLAGSGTGTNAVPVSFVNRLREHLIENSAVRQLGATVLNTAGGEELRIPKTTAHQTASLIGENTDLPSTLPTLATTTLKAFKYANLFQLSREFLQDEAVNVMEYLARINGVALGNAAGAHMITGAGTTLPWGVATRATVGVTQTGGPAAPTGDSLINLQHSIVSGYRSRAAWLMNDTTLSSIRKIKELTSGSNQYLWQPGLQAGQPDTLLGRPIVTDPNVAGHGTNGFKSVLYGDFSAYYIRDVQSVSFERSDDFAFGKDLVTFRAIIRTDGDLVDTNAVKAFTTGT